tara:strand:- start:831 stop:947 length:117 start_codon:yes stop_codon:yes gene_type:complete
MAQWTFLEAVIFGIVATVVSLSVMILITHLERKDKDKD